MVEEITGKELNCVYSYKNRIGDHIWWISGIQKFKNHYPDWDYQYDIKDILDEIYELNKDRWLSTKWNYPLSSLPETKKVASEIQSVEL